MISEKAGSDTVQSDHSVDPNSVQNNFDLVHGFVKSSEDYTQLLLHLIKGKNEHGNTLKSSDGSFDDQGHDVLSQLMVSGEKPVKCGDFKEADLSAFSCILNRWGAAYYFVPNDDRYSLIALPSQLDIIACACEEYKRTAISNDLKSEGLSLKDINSIVYSQYDGKDKSSEDNSYNGISQENIFGYNIGGNVDWRKVASELSVEFKEKKGFSAKENFVFSLEDAVEDSMDLEGSDSCYITIPDKGVAFLNFKTGNAQKKQYYYNEVHFADGEVISRKLDEDGLRAAKEAISKQKENIRIARERIKNYGPLSAAQKKIIEHMWFGDYDINTHSMRNYSKKFRISEVARPENSPQKLAAVLCCMQSLYMLQQKEIDKIMDVVLSDKYTAEQITAINRFALSGADVKTIADVSIPVDVMEDIVRHAEKETAISRDIAKKLAALDDYIGSDIGEISDSIHVKRIMQDGEYMYMAISESDNSIEPKRSELLTRQELDKWFGQRTIEAIEKADTDDCVSLPTGDKLKVVKMTEDSYDLHLNGRVFAEDLTASEINKRVIDGIIAKKTDSIAFENKSGMSVYGYTITGKNGKYTLQNSVDGELRDVATDVSKDEVIRSLLDLRKAELDKYISDIKAKCAMMKTDENSEKGSIIDAVNNYASSGDYSKASEYMDKLLEKSKTVMGNVLSEKTVNGIDVRSTENSDARMTDDRFSTGHTKLTPDSSFLKGESSFRMLSGAAIRRSIYTDIIPGIGENSENYCSYLKDVARYSITDSDDNEKNRFTYENTALINRQITDKDYEFISEQQINDEHIEVPDDAKKISLVFPVRYDQDGEIAVADIRNGVKQIGGFGFEVKNSGIDVYRNGINGKGIVIKDSDDKELIEYLNKNNIRDQIVNYRSVTGYAVNNTGKADYELSELDRSKLTAKVSEFKSVVAGTNDAKYADSVGYIMSCKYGVHTDAIDPPKGLDQYDLQRIHVLFAENVRKIEKAIGIAGDKGIGRGISNKASGREKGDVLVG